MKVVGYYYIGFVFVVVDDIMVLIVQHLLLSLLGSGLVLCFSSRYQPRCPA